MQDNNDSLSIDTADEKTTMQKKSVGKAFLFSLVLPGAGQYYLDEKNSALFFFGLEVAAWAGLTANMLYTDHLKEEYYSYAARHAGVNRDGKDKEYWMSIGKYDDIYAYNDRRIRERRLDELYPENGENIWIWDSWENRYTYDAKRIHASEISNQDIYFWGAITLNHLFSNLLHYHKAQYNLGRYYKDNGLYSRLFL